MLKKLQSLLWLMPFFSFFIGYQLVRFLTHTVVVVVPPLVGLHVQDAIKILSADRLNVRILGEKEDPDSPSGVIISQSPGHGKKVKPHQSIFLVITRRPPTPKTPALCGLSLEEIKAKAAQERIEIAPYFMESSYPKNSCFAQDHVPGEELDRKSLTVYISKGTNPLRVVPSFKGKTAEEVANFLKPFGIKIEFVHEGLDKDHDCKQCLVTEQAPLPGSIIDVAASPTIKLTTSA